MPGGEGRHGLLFYHLVNQADDLARLRVPLVLQLGVDQLAVDTHLKAASIRGDERHVLDHVLELLEQFASQANGPVSVVSDRAVYDFDVQHAPSANLGNYIIEATHAKTRQHLRRQDRI